jgi:probable phosphomutase (TIGR03848 family)
MTILLLIRHGENDWLKKGILVGNTPGVALNQRGIEQARALREALKSLPLRAIYSSPLQRALETATPLAEALRLPIQVRPGLADTDVGDWAGRELKELRKLPEWKQVQGEPSSFRFPGGESFVELQQRMVREVAEILHIHKPRERVALFFHADPIKLVLAHFLGMPLDQFQKLSVAPGSISILAVNRAGARLEGLNLQPTREGQFPGRT